jgi:thiol:disulfide interchange protein DsbD
MKSLAISCFLFSSTVFAQQANVVHVTPPNTLKAVAGTTVKAAISVQVDEGFHVNSNTPVDPYLIPLKLTWSPGALESTAITFPRPELEKYGFSAKPVSVFTGSFDILTRFKVAADASPGSATIAGKLHYQACNNKECLTPKTIDVSLPVEIVKPSEPSRGYWTDPRTRLTWAVADNGSGVTQAQAAYYCRNLMLGGYRDWTLPSIDDLHQLFGGAANQSGYHIAAPIKLTGWEWSASAGKDPGEQWALDFGDGGPASVVAGDSGLNRALCVRGK